MGATEKRIAIRFFLLIISKYRSNLDQHRELGLT
jgi:hypothetical protein